MPTSRRKRCTKPKPPARLWPKRNTMTGMDRAEQRRSLIEAMRLAGLECKRLGDKIGVLPVPAKPKPKPLDPVLAAIDTAPELKRLVGRVRLDGQHDDETMVWAEISPSGILTIFTHLGEDRTREIGGVASAALRARGWRTRGAGPTIGKAPGKASGVWAANLALAPLATTRTGRVTLVR